MPDGPYEFVAQSLRRLGIAIWAMAMAAACPLAVSAVGAEDAPTFAPESTAAQGLAAKSAGKSREALALLLQAHDAAQAAEGESSLAALSLGQQVAQVYRALGQHAQQLTWDERVLRLSLARDGAVHRRTVIAMLDLVQTYVDIGQEDKAGRLARSSLSTAQTHWGPDDAVTQRAYATMANVLTFQRKLDEALHYDRLALASRRRTLPPDDPLIESSINNLSASLGNVGRNAESVVLARQVLERRQRRLGDSDQATLISATNLAESLVLSGRHAEAAALAKRTLALRRTYFGPYHRDSLFTAFVYANALHNGDRTEQALQAARDGASAVLGGLREPGLSAEDRQGLLSTFVPDIQAYARWHGDAGPRHWHKGFALAESVKARSLMMALQQRDRRRLAALSPDQQSRRRALEEKVALLDQDIATHSRGEVRDQAKAAAEVLHRRELELELDSLTGGADGQAQAMSLDPARVSLPAGAAYVNWLLDPDGRLQAWVLRADGGIRYRWLGTHPRLARDIQALRESMVSPRSQARVGTLERALSKLLIRPLAPALQGTLHLIIAPDGVLASLPIEALLRPDLGHPGRLATVTRVQSLATWQTLSTRAAEYALDTNRKTLLTMGDASYSADPDMSAVRGRTRGWALKSYEGAADKPDDSAPAMLRWRNLPGTGREVDEVARMLRAASSSRSDDDVLVFKGEQASESTLRELDASGALARYRYVHFAAHGYLADDPALSAIVLAQTGLPADVDGYVRAAEWPALHLRSDVAVLSACDSGNGVALPGEGLLGLPYALFVAGNLNALLTLWAVDDEASTEFVRMFFGRLVDGDSPAAALAHTREQFRQSRRWSAPRYWAAWVLYGP